MKITWVEINICAAHGEASCDCDDYMRGKEWRLFCDEVNFGACIQQFHSGQSFYGTWEINGGGRSGPVEKLEDCKRIVEQQVIHAVRPN